MLQGATENDYCPTKQQKRLLESTEICTAVTKRKESASTVTLNVSTDDFMTRFVFVTVSVYSQTF